ncbi:MAG: MoxR family ATPase [Ardenticatenaceae bacterium]|nr:MoxR family ATPase [Ardenticatenaceae bacterium]
MKQIQKLYQALQAEAAKVIVGQEQVLTQLFITLLAGGHALMEGVPGTAKTLMAKTLSHLVHAPLNRVQFTPDLMPSDIVGTNVFNMATNQFTLRRGPVFTSILLADEINRAPAKTQAALLEAMEERQVTIDGEQHALPHPFLVIATQNPLEYEGTYPLPEAQLDRFFFKIKVDYPGAEAEEEMLARYDNGFNPHDLQAVGLRPLITPEQLAAVRQLIQKVKVEPGILRYITQFSTASRESRDLFLGGSPRASVSLLMASKVQAALQGRAYVTPDDVKAVILPVYRHRIILKPETTLEGLDADTAVLRILNTLEVPR